MPCQGINNADLNRRLAPEFGVRCLLMRLEDIDEGFRQPLIALTSKTHHSPIISQALIQSQY